MAPDDPDDALDALAEDVLDRRRRGEEVQIEQLATQHPDLAERIRKLFPVLLAVEGLGQPAPAGPPGTVGPYRLGTSLGQGGMGHVYEAVAGPGAAVPAGTRVALKLVHPHLVTDARRRARFLREAHLGREVAHPNVVRTLDAGTWQGPDGECPYLVLELLEGRTLADVLRSGGALSERLVRHVGLCLARGLRALHVLGAVHRDVKPANVMLTTSDEVRLMDLGAAGLVALRASDMLHSPARISLTGEFVGTLLYAAPEHLAGLPTDERTDLFGLGRVLEEALTGRRATPGQGPSAARLPATVSPFFSTLVQQLLATDAKRRPASADEVIRALEEGERSEWWQARAPSGPRAVFAPTSARPPEKRLRGRVAEVAWLDERLARVRRGDGAVAWIEGEAGVGKSLLLRAWCDGIAGQGSPPPTVVRARHVGGGRGRAAFVEALGALLIGPDLERRLAAHLGERAADAPQFAALLRGGAPGTPRGPWEVPAIQLLCRSLAAQAPLVVVADDVHEADAADVEALVPLARIARSVGALLVLAGQRLAPTSAATALLDVDGLETLRLLPLDEAASLEVLEDALGPQAREQAPLLALVRRAEGHPAFLWALAEHLQSTGDTDPAQLPDSVRGAMSRRLATLSREERDLLDLASCTGARFDPLWVARAAGLPALQALRTFGRLERERRLLTSEGAELRFRPRLVHETVLAELPEALRQGCHAALADALDATQGATPAAGHDVALQLATHYLEGGRPERAAPHVPSALELLGQRADHAARHALLARLGGIEGLRRLLQGAPLARALWAVAHTEGTSHADPRALEAGLEGLRVAREAGDPELEARLAMVVGFALRIRGRALEALDVLAPAAERAHAMGSVLGEARLRNGLCLTLRNLGRMDEAIAAGRAAVVLARALGDTHLVRRYEGNLGQALERSGKRDEALPLLCAAVENARLEGNTEAEARSLLKLASLHRAAALHAQAEAATRQSLELCVLSGDAHGRLIALGLLVSLLLEAGRFDQAAEQVEQSLALGQRLPGGLGYDLLKRARLRWSVGDRAGAEADVAQAEALAHDQSNARLLESVALTRARLATWEGDGAQARAYVELARRTNPQQVVAEACDAALTLGEAAEQEGALDAALSIYDQALERCDRERWRSDLGSLRLARGRVHAAAGRKALAAEDFAWAVAWAQDTGRPGVAVVAAARWASVGGSLPAARAALTAHGDRCSVRERSEARIILGRLTRDRALVEDGTNDLGRLGARRFPWATAADPSEAPPA